MEETNDIKCTVCGAPFHIASGDLVGPQSSPFCGACVKDTVAFLRHNLNRRWGGVRFYDHAKVPPPAVEKTFVFTVFQRVGESSTFKAVDLEETGVILDEALSKLKVRFPDHRIAEHLKGLWREKECGPSQDVANQIT